MVLLAYPWIAVVLGAAFMGLWMWRRRRMAAIASVVWVLYGAYEYLMLKRVLCSGECNIRVDLLLIYPVLAIGSVIALYKTLRSA
jgi:hypothetical protein